MSSKKEMKMLRNCLILGMIVAVMPLSAQNLKVCTDQKGRCGYSDLQGNVVVPCKYETAFPFRNGVGKVGKGEKFGMVDATGKELLPVKYEEIAEWGNGLYRIRSGNDYGLSSATGDLKLPVKYSLIGRLSCYGKAYVAVGGNEKKGIITGAKVGIIDADGHLIVEPRYTAVSEFSPANGRPFKDANNSLTLRDTLKTACEYLSCFDGKKNMVVDGQGNKVTPLTDKAVYLLPTSDMCGFMIQDGSKVTSGYWDIAAKKNMLISNNVKKFQAHTCTPFTGQVAKIDNPMSRASYFIDKTGKRLSDECTKAKYKDGYWIAYGKDKKGFLLRDDGQFLLTANDFQDFRFPETTDGDGLLIPAKQNGKWGVVNGQGQTLVAFEYDEMDSPASGWIWAVKDGKHGIVDAKGKIVVPFLYDDVVKGQDADLRNLWVCGTDKVYYNYDVDRQQTVGKGMRVVTAFTDGLAWVVPVDQQLSDNSIFRGLQQMYNIKATSQIPVSFGVLVDTQGNQKNWIPVPQALSSILSKVILENGGSMDHTQERRLLQTLTRAVRVYPMTGTISQDEWDF